RRVAGTRPCEPLEDAGGGDDPVVRDHAPGPQRVRVAHRRAPPSEPTGDGRHKPFGVGHAARLRPPMRCHMPALSQKGPKGPLKEALTRPNAPPMRPTLESSVLTGWLCDVDAAVAPSTSPRAQNRPQNRPGALAPSISSRHAVHSCRAV